MKLNHANCDGVQLTLCHDKVQSSSDLVERQAGHDGQSAVLRAFRATRFTQKIPETRATPLQSRRHCEVFELDIGRRRPEPYVFNRLMLHGRFIHQHANKCHCMTPFPNKLQWLRGVNRKSSVRNMAKCPPVTATWILSTFVQSLPSI